MSETLTPVRTEILSVDPKDLADRLAKRVAEKTPRVAVVGDFCLDKYLYVYPELDELSVETGLVARQVRAKRVFPGVGGTIASNLRALGVKTNCVGMIGEDGEGFDLLNSLEKIGANVDCMISSDEIQTCAYVKPMTPREPSRDGILQSPDEGEWVEGNRIDLRNPGPFPRDLMGELRPNVYHGSIDADAIIVSDQFPEESKTFFDDEFRLFLNDVAKRRDWIFFLCDSRFFVNEYRNMVVKCNANELFDAYRASQGEARVRETTLDPASEAKEREICEVGAWLARRNERPVLVTRGALGSILIEIEENGEPKATIVPAISVDPPIDVCGAGDATNAGFVFAQALGFSLAEAAYIANVVSSITIKQIGVTGVASVEDVLSVLRKQTI
ncbi:MAG: hypothetical protein IJM30_08980 [Thermoguttaceae bacterium]|nr:hypothetical protein [Thermoguttaceae bacterium]